MIPTVAALDWSAPLHPYQVDGVGALMRSEALLLADDMGLGKTVQAIAAVRLLFAEGAIRKVLIVAPAGLLAQWRQELFQWAPELSALRVDGNADERAWKWAAEKQVHLAGYETVRNDAGRAASHPWDLVILDEAQRIKNRNSQISQICKRLARRRAWALSGTPLENAEDDLASILEFVRPNQAGVRAPSLRPGFRLRAMQEDLQLRRRKQDVLRDLPPKTVIRVPLELTPDQRRAYASLEQAGRDRLVRLGSAATSINVLELITRLKQVCNFCPETGRSAKLDDLKDRLPRLRAAGHKALVFSQWVHEAYGIRRLAGELERFQPVVYTGDLSHPERSARIEAFRADPRRGLLLLSLRAGGQGLNLQEASYVFHFDRWWNPAVESQATDRAHRLGQRNAVTVYAYICTDSIEERIETILDRKRALFAELVDSVSLDVRRLLTAEDLFGLFGLAAPRSAKPRPRRQDLRERGTRVLLRAGWASVRPVGADALEATRVDEVGLERVIRVRCAEDAHGAEKQGERVWDAETLGRLEDALEG